MRNVLFLIALLVTIVATWYLRRDGAPLPQAARIAAPASPTLARLRLPVGEAAQPAPQPTPPAAVASPFGNKLGLKDEALRERLDEGIPARLYAEAARCYQGDGSIRDRDERLDLTYHIQVQDGEVTFNRLRVNDDTLTNRTLERCIRERIAAAHWRDDDLPDLDEDDDLFLKVGMFRKYLATAYDAPPPARTN
jgi:hypothetical protein